MKHIESYKTRKQELILNLNKEPRVWHSRGRNLPYEFTATNFSESRNTILFTLNVRTTNDMPIKEFISKFLDYDEIAVCRLLINTNFIDDLEWEMDKHIIELECFDSIEYDYLFECKNEKNLVKKIADCQFTVLCKAFLCDNLLHLEPFESGNTDRKLRKEREDASAERNRQILRALFGDSLRKFYTEVPEFKIVKTLLLNKKLDSIFKKPYRHWLYNLFRQDGYFVARLDNNSSIIGKLPAKK